MTTTEQIKAIAALDGWVTPALDCVTVPKHKWTNKNDGCCYAECPPYLTSYDAIIPVIQKQPRTVRESMAPISFMSTPAQLCELLLAATGKWK